MDRLPPKSASSLTPNKDGDYMIVRLDSYKIAYAPMPKAGCSSVKEALARLDPDVTIPPEDQITTMTWHDI